MSDIHFQFEAKMQTLADLIIRYGLIKITNQTKRNEAWDKIYAGLYYILASFSFQNALNFDFS